MALLNGTADALSIVPLLKTMMVPSEHQSDIFPDIGVSGVNAFVHSIECSFGYDVKADALPGTVGNLTWSDVVPYSSGLYLSLPQESHESLWHMGFVGPNTGITIASDGYDLFPTNPRGFDVRFHYFGAQQENVVLGLCTKYPGSSLIYVGELALPRVGPNFGITYSPNVSDNYSKVRAFASDFKMSSTTISGTNFNIGGVFHSGVIADTRYVSQVTMDTTAARLAYPAAALISQSITRPDDLHNVPVSTGAIDLMGPDYPREWCATDVDNTDTLHSEWKRYKYSVSSTPVIPMQTYVTGLVHGAYHIAQLWITSTDTEFHITNQTSPSGVGAPTNWQRIYYGPINEDGILDVDVTASVSIAGDFADLSNPLTYRCFANFIHVFAYADVDGTVHYNLSSENQQYTLTGVETLQVVANSNGGVAGIARNVGGAIFPQAPHIFKSRPRMCRNGMQNTTGGKYLGTLCTLSIIADDAFGYTREYAVYAYPGTVRVRARNVNAPGRVGPAHIIRYDNVGIGQQIAFAGTQWMQGIALGHLSPFIKTNGMSLTVPDNIFAKFVDLLWAMSPLYRRIMSLEQYNRIVKPYFTTLDVKELMLSIEKMDSATSVLIKSLGNAGGWLPAAQSGAGQVGGGGNVLHNILAGMRRQRDA
jgi:hypothetical protein